MFVFLSYARKDQPLAEEIEGILRTELPKQGDTAVIEVWRDKGHVGLGIGDDWRQEIDDSIRNAHVLVVLVTEESAKSDYVKYEWAFALGAGLKVMPVLLEKNTLHPRLAALQYLDLTQERKWETLIPQLRKYIEERKLQQDPWLE